MAWDATPIMETASEHIPAKAEQSSPHHTSSTTSNDRRITRKPLPTISSPSLQSPALATGGKVVAIGVEPSEQQPTTTSWQGDSAAPTSQSLPTLVVRDLDQFPHGETPNIPQSAGFTPFHELSPDEARGVINQLERDNELYPTSIYTNERTSLPNSPPVIVEAASSSQPLRPFHQQQRSMTMPMKTAPSVPLQMPAILTTKNSGPSILQRQNSSASTKISSFFGWKAAQNTSPIEETSPTTISESSSVAGSPDGTHATSMSSYPHGIHKPLPPAIDVPRANARSMAMLSGSSFPQAPPTPAMSLHLEEMEEELKDLSEELARSIAREIELEEQLESIQESNKRTSDYFSDSGTSAREQEVEDEARKVKRRSQQEKINLKVGVSQRVQEERMKRKALEEQVRVLETQLAQGGPGGSEKILELQTALEDNRRRLIEEKKHKENYEDLIAALRVDLVHHKNERDNLKDEVVPSLRARLEGLESDSQEHQKLAYENTRMQQEMQALKASKFGSIAEEGSEGYGLGLSRSTSQRKTAGGISRSNSVSKKGQITESRESLIERVKDAEAQRDALHRALKSLLDRQRHQIREHEKRTQQLETERDRALEASSPRRRGYEKEVKDLRYEINQLRKRAEEALEQKWQCEKGLGGLKMDLDRAEQETSSLRRLLLENDILVPEMSAADLAVASHATSASLEKAYRELRAAQRVSLEKLRSTNGISGIQDPKAMETLDMLLKTMSDAEAERDFAQKQAASFRAQAESLATANEFHDVENVALANELQASASRTNQLNTQVRKQLDANSELRERLAEAVGKGEREQQQSATKINMLQSKLRALEDRLMVAQQESEDSMALHEEDVRVIRKSNNSQLQRLRTSRSSSVRNSHVNGLSAPKSPMYPRSPRLDKTTSGPGISMPEALQTEFLESRVKALEAALAEADSEMGEVVQRMNAAQIEVLELQSARDEAMRQTRLLQNKIIAELQAMPN